MIYVLYIVVAAIVVAFSNKASEYVDIIDKKSNLSGAFIGGVMLSAVTSLPELFTSISSTLMLGKPGLCMGNILGSDLFNLATISFFILVFFKPYKSAKVAPSHIKVNIFVWLIYAAMALNWLNVLNFEVMTVNITSIVIVVLYVLGIKFMSSDESSTDEEDSSELTMKQVIARFVLVSIGIVVSSIVITYITDIISEKLGLGQGLAGALFLGIATSLPELASTVALFRMKNYNIAMGNIIGSNIFNFIILALTDILYVGNGVYDFSDPKNVNLLIFGAIATPVMLVMMKFKNKVTQVICPLGVLASYIAFLVV